MKRTDEIRAALVTLRAESHPGELSAELRRLAVQNAGTPAGMGKILDALQEAAPEVFAAAVRDMEIPSRRRGTPSDDVESAFMLASFKRDKEKTGIGRESWALERGGEALDGRLKRAMRRYSEDPIFSALVDQHIELLNMLEGGT